MRIVCLLLTFAFVVSGCATSNIHGDREVVAKGGPRPEWVNDVSKQNQKDLADFLDHEEKPPQYYYAVSQASVDSEKLIQSCYEYARTNSSNEFARSIIEEVRSSSATASDTGSDSFYQEIMARTKSKIVGAKILAKHWETTMGKEKDKRTTCWIISGISSKHYEKLKAMAEKKISEEGDSKHKRAKDLVQSN